MEGVFSKNIVTIYDAPCVTKITERGIESTIADEGLYGLTFTVISECDENEEYLKIRTHYGYEGYVNINDVLIVPDEELVEYRNRNFRVVDAVYADVLSIAHVSGEIIISLTRGALVSLLKPAEKKGGYCLVELVDGREGYIKEGCLMEYIAPMTENEFRNKLSSGELDENALRMNIVNTAKKYLGTQYRWGGKSSLGIDCSGMTSMSYMLNGILTYRDAKIVEGYPVKEISREELKPADLIYFPGHIAMYIGNNEYIHSTAKNGSDGVVINSLDENAPNYREDLPGIIKAYGSVF